MNRPIKFRAWIKDAEMCYEESGMYYQDDQYISSFFRRIFDQYVVNHESSMKFDITERLMQFTGLLDKNGKEIYEGDIISIFEDKKPWMLVSFSEKYHGFVTNHISQEDSTLLLGDADHVQKKWEIIGNIYQNPELLNTK